MAVFTEPSTSSKHPAGMKLQSHCVANQCLKIFGKEWHFVTEFLFPTAEYICA